MKRVHAPAYLVVVSERKTKVSANDIVPSIACSMTDDAETTLPDYGDVSSV